MKAVIAGGGPIGLATAMLLARDGWSVRVFEKDPAEPPADPLEAWSEWERPGVAQFRQPHIMLARFRHVLDAELPQVRDRMAALGARRVNLVETLPRTIADRSPREGDDRFETLTARRPVVEAAFAQVARETPGVEVVRGVSVSELVAVPGMPPHVTGVRLSTGETVGADLVVDAMGRRSRLPEWVEAIGGRRPYEEATDHGFAYYARHFRSRSGDVPEFRGPFGGPLGSFNAVTQPADNGTWSVGIVAFAGDQPLKALRHPEVWERVARSVPHLAHWVDGEPLTDVIPMAGVLDRYRRFVVDGAPVVTGAVAVGDAWASTNPQAGRGFTLGLRHAVALRDAVREHADDPAGLATAFDEFTESELTPWYRDQVDRDAARAADLQALISGQPPAPPDPQRQMQATFLAAAAHDPDVARAFLEVMSCLTLPAELMTRPGLPEKVISHFGTPVPQAPAPSRDELLRLLDEVSELSA